MKRITIAAALMGIALAASAQSNPTIDCPDSKFTTELAHPLPSVKDQRRSGTCWAYSTIV